MPGLGGVDLIVRAHIPLAGTYASAITLVYAGKRETTALLVERTRVSPTVQVLGMETARDWTWPLPFKRDAMFWLSLQETAG